MFTFVFVNIRTKQACILEVWFLVTKIVKSHIVQLYDYKRVKRQTVFPAFFPLCKIMTLIF